MHRIVTFRWRTCFVLSFHIAKSSYIQLNTELLELLALVRVQQGQDIGIGCPNLTQIRAWSSSSVFVLRCAAAPHRRKTA
jgi:hypothetical protein